MVCCSTAECLSFRPHFAMYVASHVGKPASTPWSTLLLSRLALRLTRLACVPQAARLDAKMTLPHLGIAQMALAAEETTNAATELQAVLDLAPGNIDALRLLGQLIKDMPDRVERSLSLFREAAEKKQEDAELQELYAELASGIDPQGEGVGDEKETKVMQGARCEWQFHDM